MNQEHCVWEGGSQERLVNKRAADRMNIFMGFIKTDSIQNYQ